MLHPSVRTRREPRISATALAEYLILRPGGQQNILHDSKYSRPPIITANGDAMRALRAYNTDPRREKDTLLRVKAALTTKAAGVGVRPKVRDEALRCVEIIDLFERAENALGTRTMLLVEPPDFDLLEIEGVSVSVHPDFIVQSGDRVGAGMLRVAKAPDPSACAKPETAAKRGDQRRELGRYLIAIMQILLDAQNGALGIPDPDLSFVADVRLGERINRAADHSIRVRDIRGACQQIARLWDAIEPKPALLRP
jgi:hypothetical protein